MTLERNTAIETLRELVESTLGGTNPQKKFIDNVVPEKILDLFPPQDVLRVAFEYGFIITKCSADNKLRANGCWIDPTEELAKRIETYDNISHGYCDGCCEKLLKEYSLN